MKTHLFGCAALAALLVPTFKAEAQVTAPYTDFDGVTADPTVFTVAQRNSNTVTTSVNQPNAPSNVGATYGVSIGQDQTSYSAGYGNNLGTSMLTATNLSGGDQSAFTETATFTTVSTGVNFAIGLSGLGGSTNAFGNAVITPTAFVLTNGTLGFYNYLEQEGGQFGGYSYNPIASPDVSTVSNTPFANALVDGATFNMTLTGSFSPDGSVITLNYSVTDTGTTSGTNDANIGKTATETVTMNTSDLTGSANAFGLFYQNNNYPSTPNLITDFSDYSLTLGLPAGVPEPATTWLAGLGLFALLGVARAKCVAARKI